MDYKLEMCPRGGDENLVCTRDGEFHCRNSHCWVLFFSSRRRHTRLQGDWSSDVCSSDLKLNEKTDAKPEESKEKDDLKEEIIAEDKGLMSRKIGRASCRERV